ncbi:MAG: hypothetical protein LBD25_04450 [Coriobacteriales bacterium]|jgi:hypothetical protein|nr:hypothetical protein [Coriobacteriales bacterium]
MRIPVHITKRGRAGVTLLESVIAAAIIVVVALTMATAFMAASSANLRASGLNRSDEHNEQAYVLGAPPAEARPGHVVSFPGGSLEGEVAVYRDADGTELWVFSLTAAGQAPAPAPAPAMPPAGTP